MVAAAVKLWKAKSRKKAPPVIPDDAGRFLVLEWRPMTEAPAPTAKPAPGEGEHGERGSRRRRRGRGRGRGRENEVATEETTEMFEDVDDDEPVAAKPQAPAPPPRPVEPERPFITTPADAPQIAVLGGVPTIVMNLRAYPPILFFGNSSDEKRARTVQDEVRLAGENGVHIHAHLLEFEVVMSRNSRRRPS